MLKVAHAAIDWFSCWYDNKFVDCAFAGRAEYLVTEDSHFKVLHGLDFPSIGIRSIQEFADLLQ